MSCQLDHGEVSFAYGPFDVVKSHPNGAFQLECHAHDQTGFLKGREMAFEGQVRPETLAFNTTNMLRPGTEKRTKQKSSIQERRQRSSRQIADALPTRNHFPRFPFSHTLSNFLQAPPRYK